jgi:hypothetical protein
VNVVVGDVAGNHEANRRDMQTGRVAPCRYGRLLSPHGSPPEERHCTQHSTLAFELQKAAVEQKQVWIGLGTRHGLLPPDGRQQNESKHAIYFLPLYENPSTVTKLRRSPVAIFSFLWE